MKKIILLFTFTLFASLCHAQSSFTLEWTSPANEQFYMITNTEKNNQVPEIITSVGTYPNYQYKIYDGATKTLKRTFNSLGDSSYINFPSNVPVFSIDVNSDNIFEYILLKYNNYQSAYLKVLNGVNGSMLFNYNYNSVYPDYQLLDIDGDNYVELCISDGPPNGEYQLKVYSTTSTIGLDNNSKTVTEYELKQNYPNPFNPTTTIEYSIKTKADVQIIIFDVLGREVKTLAEGMKSAGNYKANLDGTNLSSGTYFYQLVVDGMMETKKMVLVK